MLSLQPSGYLLNHVVEPGRAKALKQVYLEMLVPDYAPDVSFSTQKNRL